MYFNIVLFTIKTFDILIQKKLHNFRTNNIIKFNLKLSS